MKRYLFSLLLIATTTLFNSCQKEVSLENSDSPSEGLLQSDISGECAPMTVSGIYEAGTPLVGTSNYIDVEVDVAVVGSYTIYSDTVNGVFFRATGVFSAIGLNTIRLPGTGTPTAAGIHNFVITYGLSACTVDVATLPDGGAVPAVFEFDGDPGDCMNYNLLGAYTTGTALTNANKVEISVDVTTIGTYDITTVASNGMIFKGQGVLGTVGPNTITLTGQGTPATAGTTNINVTAGATTCSFEVDVVGPGAYTINCGTAVPNGTYMKGVALTAANSVDVQVTVATPGSFNITGTANGMTFSKVGTFTTAGAQTVNLLAAGTPTNDGTTAVTLSGGTGTCSFNITVLPAATGPATYAINCGSAVVNGTYTVGVALTGTNTVNVTVNVTTAGSYTITGTLNGITLNKTGVFAATGPQTVSLAATGTPTTQGANAVPVTGGTPACSISITVAPPAAGAAVYAIDCTSADINGFYTENVALTTANFVDIDVTVTTPGTYTITGTINGMTFSKTGTFSAAGVEPVRLNGTGTPTADGDFNVALTGGTPGCSFEVTVFPNAGTWRFNQGATVFQGVIVDGTFDNTNPNIPPGSTVFLITGVNAANDVFIMDLLDLSGAINAAGELYPMVSPTPTITTNLGFFAFEAGTPPTTFGTDPTDPGNVMTTTVTSHNLATKTVTGTFTGQARNQGGALVSITSGQFTVTYP